MGLRVAVAVEIEATVAGRLDHDDAQARGEADGVEVGLVDLGGQAAALHLQQENIPLAERSCGVKRLHDSRRHVAIGARKMLFGL